MVTKFVPFPPDSGGKHRSLAVLHTLLEAGDVTLCAFDDGRGDEAALRALGVDVRSVPRPGAAAVARGAARVGSVTAGRFWSSRLLAEAQATADRGPIDVLLVVYSHLAPYGRSIPARHRILDLQNIESSLLESYAGTTSSRVQRTVARVEAAALRRIEHRACDTFDTVAVVTDEDARRLPGTPDRLLVCANGMTPPGPFGSSPERTVAFVGLLGWRPNVSAARWLVREVWPHVRREVPDAQLLLVGRDPAPEVRSFASDDITVTGSVPDVAPYLERARVAVAPLLAGGGSRLKILEALGAGRPVVATAVGAEGLTDLVDHGLTIADRPERFAAEVARRLLDPELAAAEGSAGSSYVRDRYSWQRTMAPLAEELRRVRAM